MAFSCIHRWFSPLSPPQLTKVYKVERRPSGHFVPWLRQCAGWESRAKALCFVQAMAPSLNGLGAQACALSRLWPHLWMVWGLQRRKPFPQTSPPLSRYSIHLSGGAPTALSPASSHLSYLHLNFLISIKNQRVLLNLTSLWAHEDSW